MLSGRKRKYLPILVLLAAAGGILLWMGTSVAQAKEGWLSDYDAALAKAQVAEKPVLIDFTGSDWCGWCMRLNDEVFSTDRFKKWAEGEVILLEVDFPRNKEQSAETKKRNQALAKKYGVQGFPTIVLTDPSGQEIGRLGYQKGGADAWIESAERILKDWYASQTMQLADSLDEAMARAKDEGMPLALFVAHSDAEAEADRKLFENSKLYDVTNQATVAVHVRAKQAPKAVSELRERTGLNEGARVALIDLAGPKVAWQSSEMPPADQLAGKLRENMPRIAYDGDWLVDQFARARRIAAQRDKPLLVDFTGSDWCGWCKKLDAEVFETETFRDYAEENLVLVKLDFPRQRSQPEEVKQRNMAVARKFGVRGFPTLVILSPEGEPIGKMGYVKGGPDPFLAQLKNVLQDGTTRTE